MLRQEVSADIYALPEVLQKRKMLSPPTTHLNHKFFLKNKKVYGNLYNIVQEFSSVVLLDYVQ
ncbi:Hypothetical predicted protein [Podarcis lilfordi]|uniref:Uncharacterized protein n=1 Tax=Podarcis lilfordi TaxID=74358 RepID=A0AA35P799_9SAUR|nr:Hypothetical predicted protein [Podarcis lilfordi]